MSLMCHEEVKDDKPFHKSGQNVSRIALCESSKSKPLDFTESFLIIYFVLFNDKKGVMIFFSI